MRGPVGTPEARAALVAAYQRRNYPPERVAAAILKAIARNRPVAPVAAEAWVMYYMKRFLPRLTARLNHGMGARLLRAQSGTR